MSIEQRLQRTLRLSPAAVFRSEESLEPNGAMPLNTLGWRPILRSPLLQFCFILLTLRDRLENGNGLTIFMRSTIVAAIILYAPFLAIAARAFPRPIVSRKVRGDAREDTPPIRLEFLLRALLQPSQLDDIADSLDQLYARELALKGKGEADRWHARQANRLTREYLIEKCRGAVKRVFQHSAR